MCSISDSFSVSTLKDELEGLVLNEKGISERCESNRSLIHKHSDLNDEMTEIDKKLNEAFLEKTPVMPQHRQNLMKEASEYIKSALNELGDSKVADVINIEGGGPVHVGHVINITEQVVLNRESNELEYGSRKGKDYTHYFTMVDRMHWLAQPSVAELEDLRHPVKYVIICHTATQESFTQAENVLLLRLLQTFHIESKGWADVAYNFCIGSDGNAYEGRGWLKVGSHTLSYNRHSVGIAFIGCFLNHLPPKTALKKCRDLIKHGIRIGVISPDYELVAHCQCRPFLSPGPRLFEELKTWEHFNPDINNLMPCDYES